MKNYALLLSCFAALVAAFPIAEDTAPSKTINVVTNVRRATGVVVTGAMATTVNDSDGNGAGSDTYTLHRGGGAAGFPAINLWVNFVDMFDNNKDFMFEACEDNGYGANDSGEEVGDIWNAIEAVAATTKLDHRFILAVILQESGGCVRVDTSTSPDGSVTNPGLMQDYDGTASCHGVNPCPQATVSTVGLTIQKPL
jgi:hypothetical protein